MAAAPARGWRERTGHEREQHLYAHPLAPRRRVSWAGFAVLPYALVVIEWVEDSEVALAGRSVHWAVSDSGILLHRR